MSSEQQYGYESAFKDKSPLSSLEFEVQKRVGNLHGEGALEAFGALAVGTEANLSSLRHLRDKLLGRKQKN